MNKSPLPAGDRLNLLLARRLISSFAAFFPNFISESLFIYHISQNKCKLLFSAKSQEVPPLKDRVVYFFSKVKNIENFDQEIKNLENF